MRPPRPSVVDVVEQIYADVETTAPHEWLLGVTDGLRALGIPARGAFSYAYDISGPVASWRISRPLARGMPARVAEDIHASFVAAAPEQRLSLARLGPSGTLSLVTGVRLRDLPPRGAEAADELGVADVVYVNAADPDRRGVFVGLAVEGAPRLAPAHRRRLAMIAAHVASARRLLVSGRTEPVAIFDTSGKAAHVAREHEGALESLRRHARAAGMRAAARDVDADEVLARWQALVAGRYSVIRRFDSDGRRCVMAYENPPNVSDPRGLSPREAAVANLARHGHSQKLIAYELGLAPGTVSGLLARVFAKLRVRTTTSLIDRLCAPEHVTRASEGGRELLLFESPPAPSSSAAAELSEAERAVALAAARGETNVQIARARGTKPVTIQHQLTSIYRKLGVGTRAELAAHLLAREAR